MKFIKSFVKARIFDNSGGLSGLSRSMAIFGVSRALSIVDLLGFSLFFNSLNADEENDKTREVQLLLIRAREGDEEAVRELREMIATLDRYLNEDNQYAGNIRLRLRRYFTDLSSAEGFEGTLAAARGEGRLSSMDTALDFHNLSADDFAREDVQQRLIDYSVLAAYNDEMQGQFSWTRTGDPGVDNWIYNTLYSLGSNLTFRDHLFKYVLIYKTLCYGRFNPGLAYAKALTAFVMERILFNRFYFQLRHYSIGQ